MHPTATGPSPVTHGDPVTTSPIQPATNHSVGQSPSHPHGESLVRGPAIDESRVQLATGDAVPASFKDLSWQDRLAHIEDTMREVSKETHPQAMVKAYARRMRGTIEPGHTIFIVLFLNTGIVAPALYTILYNTNVSFSLLNKNRC